MISKFTDKNNYGGYTWRIKIDSLHHIFIHGTDSNSYVVEFKEWKYINYKNRFSFVSNNDLELTITEAFDRVFEYFLGKKDYLWTNDQKNNKLNKVLFYIDRNEE